MKPDDAVIISLDEVRRAKFGASNAVAAEEAAFLSGYLAALRVLTLRFSAYGTCAALLDPDASHRPDILTTAKLPSETLAGLEQLRKAYIDAFRQAQQK